MGLIDGIASPLDVKALPEEQLGQLAAEIRQFLVDNVSKTGGHLGPNLGVVELTIAIHRVFSSPRDALVFDTGHQAYVHKILTGRTDFSGLRQESGLSGYPSRAESEHDVVENSHASTSLSWADGIARAFQLSGQDDRHVVAIIGDGAMTGGMAWEALNNIAEDPTRPLIVVINDNDRSYAPTVGGLVRKFDPMRRLDSLRVSKNYEAFLGWTRRTLQDAGPPGRMAYGALHSIKRGVKDIFVDAGIFDSMGLKYIGPIDGHDTEALTEALELAKGFGGPVVVHAITDKGRGYEPAENDSADRFHAVGKIHPETGLPVRPDRFGWTSVFAREIVDIARKDPGIVGVTAAMLRPVGLGQFAEAFPERVVDVGIAEQHALTMAAGLSRAGMHPVVALYATFMNRGFDQLLMDIALHGEAVTIVLDRAGITGDDGPSHNGMWDLSLAAMVPGLRTAAPRDGKRLAEQLRQAVAHRGPTLIRYPKGELPEPIEAIETVPAGDILYRGPSGANVAVVAVGSMVPGALEAAEASGRAGIVVDPGWVLPVSDELVSELAAYDGVVTVEDGIVDGGVGSEISLALARAGYRGAVAHIGIGREFLAHAKRPAIMARQAMRAEDIAAAIDSVAR
ncbi:MAG: 1-deoxy-D-xylulose-5-phosphate synthase [Actinomycetaceae bacterium]|nr:1-deoxy-D-xylulose-5-phosphate synthase [Actinomycetaceae bacterium]